MGRWGQVRPYAALLKALGDAGADVLVVPYDWRLSNRHNARLLERRILERWYHGDPPPRERRRPEEERITFIGHSMGGLVARCFLESHPLGPVLGRRLITIGTPHRGAPAAYLHLIGRTHPFPESPFAAWAHATLVREARAAGAALQGELAAQLIPGSIQTALVRFMGSTFELLPNYNFVRNRGSSEPWPDTYAQQVHHPTGEPAIRLIRRFRSSIVDERELAGWLRTRDLEYHFLGATGFPTVIGYDRGRDRLLTGREGDGTVPLDSARLQPVSTGNLQVKTLFRDDDFSHQKLCQRARRAGVLPKRPERPAAGIGRRRRPGPTRRGPRGHGQGDPQAGPREPRGRPVRGPAGRRRRHPADRHHHRALPDVTAPAAQAPAEASLQPGDLRGLVATPAADVPVRLDAVERAGDPPGRGHAVPAGVLGARRAPRDLQRRQPGR